MDDMSWILADGEDLEDALEDFKAEVENPELLKARHDAIRALADPYRTPEQKQREADMDAELEDIAWQYGDDE
jgi:hypothetical protein